MNTFSDLKNNRGSAPFAPNDGPPLTDVDQIKDAIDTAKSEIVAHMEAYNGGDAGGSGGGGGGTHSDVILGSRDRCNAVNHKLEEIIEVTN